MSKIILNHNQLQNEILIIKNNGRKVVFTNGCFDILHAGHVDYLNKAKSSGDILVVALNSDASISRIKGDKRPIVPFEQRAFVISNLQCVDFVTIFEEDTPAEVIEKILPNVLVKGADWDETKIVGRDTVLKNGGEIKRIEFEFKQSTSNIISFILEKYGQN
jgi:rfaE bifunctional protein nucleotidyltransferase chain/domain